LRAEHPVRFETKVLTVDANEGVDVGDVDADGRVDVVAGRCWYRNDEWIPRPDFLFDVNHDGLLDVIAGDFFTPSVFWYENPGAEGLRDGLLWKQHLLADTQQATNEFSMLHDVDQDGTPEWITNSWNRESPLIVWRFVRRVAPAESESPADRESATAGAPRLVPHVIGMNHNGHGMGFGDINNDGREDILVASGWYERPAGDAWATNWEFHADWQRDLSCPFLVRDLDGDGRQDMLWGNPHDFGLYAWYALSPAADGKLMFREVAIDGRFSQLHCLHLADLDGDGRLELITGKRWRAHNGKDPGGGDPPAIWYYELSPDKGGFARHLIDVGSVGIGLQIRTSDIDADGDLDIVVAGKDGTQILFQQ
jgi:hypothetical protein